MAWFALARVLFVAAVGYSAHQLQPLGPDPLFNFAFGSVLGLLIVVVELRLKTTSVTHMIGALLGGATGLLAAKTIGAALLGESRNDASFFCQRDYGAGLWAWLLAPGRGSRAHLRISCRCLARWPRKRYKVGTSVTSTAVRRPSVKTGSWDRPIDHSQCVLKELQLVADRPIR